MTEDITETAVYKILAEYSGFDADAITQDTTLEALGLDSLDKIDLIMGSQDRFGLVITEGLSDHFVPDNTDGRTAGDVKLMLEVARTMGPNGDLRDALRKHGLPLVYGREKHRSPPLNIHGFDPTVRQNRANPETPTGTHQSASPFRLVFV